MDRIEEQLQKEFEGYLLLNLSATRLENIISFSKTYYTVLEGRIYQIHNGNLHPDEKTTFIELYSTCKNIGKYDRNKIYFSTVKEYSFEEAIDLLGLDPSKPKKIKWSKYIGYLTYDDAIDVAKKLNMRLPTAQEIETDFANGLLETWQFHDGLYWTSDVWRNENRMYVFSISKKSGIIAHPKKDPAHCRFILKD